MNFTTKKANSEPFLIITVLIAIQFFVMRTVFNLYKYRFLAVVISLFAFLTLTSESFAEEAAKEFTLNGVVIDKETREPVAFATVSIWKGTKYAISDAQGKFQINNLPAGAYRIQVDILGYNQYISEEFMISNAGYFIRAEIEQESRLLNQITVKPKADPFRRFPESPLSQRSIGVQEIERNPGANRDISRVVGSLPGVGSVTAGGYRNDLLVRGGGPSENKFFLDGIEIPTINHFSTQGSSGGPVGIIDADFIREVDFYGGTFPVNKGGAISSVLDFKLKDGDPVNNSYKFTLGASEAGISSNGHLSNRTNYLVSARTSYLQFLFKAIGLPFLPSFTDAQFKIETRFDNKHELTILGLAGFDNMTLNDDTGGKEENEYILAYLPVIQQEVFTLGAAYRYFYGKNNLNLYLSHSYLNNRNIKYRNNDESSETNLTLRYKSVEQETKFRLENISRMSDFRLTAGFGFDMPQYSNDTYQKVFLSQPVTINYNSDLNFVKYALFTNVNYTSPNKKISVNLGARADGNSFSSHMSNPLNQFSPRLSFSYEFAKNLYLNWAIGKYYQLPPLTAMGFRDNAGELVNKDLKYIKSYQAALGVDFRNSEGFQFGVEFFHKLNYNGLYSVNDSIPVEGKATNYGVVGNEEISSQLESKAFGAEFSFRWFVSDKFNLISSITLFRSQFKNNDGQWNANSWDNRRLMTISGGYKLPGDVVIGAKFRYSGGSPYTPLDEVRSSYVAAWDASGRAYRDNSQYNSLYLKQFNQLDVRVDKEFYFKKFALKVYLDIQNALNKKYKESDVLVSTGRVINPQAPYSEQRYEMKRISIENGVLLPSIGVTVEF
ncbi:TonB-dependent receptor [Bacteroidota bacterium]